MGNKQSRDDPLHHLRLNPETLKELTSSPALVWSAENLASWLLYHQQDELAHLILTKRIDGECLLETSPDQLQAWLGKLTSKQSDALSIIIHDLKSQEFISIFLNPPAQDPMKLRATDKIQLPENMDKDAAREIILRYHTYTSHTEKGGAPSLSRNWVYQPKNSRRYYGAQVLKLQTPPSSEDSQWRNSHLLDSLIYYSFSVSAGQNSQQSMMAPRAKGTKRTNPSRYTIIGNR
jgi:hypothetical protein